MTVLSLAFCEPEHAVACLFYPLLSIIRVCFPHQILLIYFLFLFSNLGESHTLSLAGSSTGLVLFMETRLMFSWMTGCDQLTLLSHRVGGLLPVKQITCREGVLTSIKIKFLRKLSPLNLIV